MVPWIGFAVKGGIVLALVLTVFLLLRWFIRRIEKGQAERDTVERLKAEAREEAKKLKAAQAAEEIRREARRDPSSGLPVDLGLRRVSKPLGRPVDKPPTGDPASPGHPAG